MGEKLLILGILDVVVVVVVGLIKGTVKNGLDSGTVVEVPAIGVG